MHIYMQHMREGDYEREGREEEKGREKEGNMYIVETLIQVVDPSGSPTGGFNLE